jgi:serine/threonine-protein kinase HipA
MNLHFALEVRLERFVQPVGFLLSYENSATRFVYAEAYLSTADAVPLSLALPLVPEPFDDPRTRAFFDNLLPENDQLQQVMDREGLARDDVVGLLAQLGADCPGAISCLPVGSAPVKIPGDIATDYDELDTESLREIVRRLADREPLPDAIRDPSPIAGVQRKIAIAQISNDRFALPKTGLRVPTTHILKVPRRSRGREARLEAAAARLARVAGLSVVVPEVIEMGELQALLIPRFDRLVDADGRVSRIHQEDFAQALGLPARLKYQRYGTPERCFDLRAILKLLDATAEPAISHERFIASAIFNLAVGNSDNHAKNYALLYDRGPAPRLAPLYDLLPTRLDSNVTHELSFNIGTASHPDNIQGDDLLAFFAAFGLSQRRAVRFLERTVAPLLGALDRAASSLTAEGMKDFDDLIGRETARLMNALGVPVQIRPRDHYEARAGGWQAMS